MTSSSALPFVDTLPATLFLRLALDLAFSLVTAAAVYHRLYGRRDFAFTFVALNLVTFLIAFLLSSVPVELGFALGLFGIFGILRYRTEAIEVRELTYLFVFIGYALVNAVASQHISPGVLLAANITLLATVGALEAMPFSRRQESRHIRYDRLELLDTARREELLVDLRARSRLPVDRVEVGAIDLLRDTAELTVFLKR